MSMLVIVLERQLLRIKIYSHILDTHTCIHTYCRDAPLINL